MKTHRAFFWDKFFGVFLEEFNSLFHTMQFICSFFNNLQFLFQFSISLNKSKIAKLEERETKQILFSLCRK